MGRGVSFNIFSPDDGEMSRRDREVAVEERKNLQSITRKLRVVQTPWESKLWHYLRAGRFQGLKFKRQVPMGNYVVDFCCQEKKIIIEVDGGQHNEMKNRKIDALRDNYLKNKGYIILRFWNNGISDNFEGVLEVIRRTVAADDLSPILSPSPGERGK